MEESTIKEGKREVFVPELTAVTSAMLVVVPRELRKLCPAGAAFRQKAPQYCIVIKIYAHAIQSRTAQVSRFSQLSASVQPVCNPHDVRSSINSAPPAG